MNRLEVDRALGQTLCICGDVENWHPQCYARFLGRPQREIDAAMDRAYRTARRKLRERAKAQAGEALMMANEAVAKVFSSAHRAVNQMEYQYSKQKFFLE